MRLSARAEPAHPPSPRWAATRGAWWRHVAEVETAPKDAFEAGYICVEIATGLALAGLDDQMDEMLDLVDFPPMSMMRAYGLGVEVREGSTLTATARASRVSRASWRGLLE